MGSKNYTFFESLMRVFADIQCCVSSYSANRINMQTKNDLKSIYTELTFMIRQFIFATIFHVSKATVVLTLA